MCREILDIPFLINYERFISFEEILFWYIKIRVQEQLKDCRCKEGPSDAGQTHGD